MPNQVEVRLHVLQRAHVAVQIDVPRRGVRVFLARRVGGQFVEVRLRPEALGEFRQAKRFAVIDRLPDDPFRLPALEQRVEVHALHQPRPFLSPAVAQPVRRDELGHGLVVTLRQLVARPAMQLLVERPCVAHQLLRQRLHLRHRHAKAGHLQAEERTEAHLARHAIAQFAELDQSRLERHAGFLRRLPHREPLGEVRGGLEHVVNLIGGDRLGVASRRAASI